MSYADFYAVYGNNYGKKLRRLRALDCVYATLGNTFTRGSINCVDRYVVVNVL